MSFSTNGCKDGRAGYGREDIERHGRGFADVAENIFRLSCDAYANQYFTVRGSFDVGRRRGSGFVETGLTTRPVLAARSRRCATTTRRIVTAPAVQSS